MIPNEKITAYYKAVCKNEGVTPIPLKFGKVGKGGAVIYYKDTTPLEIKIQPDKCDVEHAVLHELAHQILISKNGNGTHNSTFKRLECRLIEEYFYSEFSKILWQK